MTYSRSMFVRQHTSLHSLWCFCYYRYTEDIECGHLTAELRRTYHQRQEAYKRKVSADAEGDKEARRAYDSSRRRFAARRRANVKRAAAEAEESSRRRKRQKILRESPQFMYVFEVKSLTGILCLKADVALYVNLCFVALFLRVLFHFGPTSRLRGSQTSSIRVKTKDMAQIS